MRDKRPVDELTIEELERVLAIRRREERQKRLKRMKDRGRVMVDVSATPNAVAQPVDKPMMPQNGDSTTRSSGSSSSQQTSQQNVPPVKKPVQESMPRFEEEEDAESNETVPVPSTKSKSGGNRVFNSLLLVVEIVAVLGLVFIGVTMFLEVATLQNETAAAQQLANQQRLASLPTIEPTPIIQGRIEDYVLPGGHTIDANGNAQFNLAEFIDDVPSHLQSTVVNQVFPVDFRRPAPTSETALYLNIPKLGIDQAIVQGTDWEALKLGVGQVQNGANPGDSNGNVALAAHNDVYGELFRYIGDLEPGDEFQIQTQTQTYTYRVTGSEIVKPNDVHVLQNQGQATATLITCYPYQVNTERLVVFAQRVDDSL